MREQHLAAGWARELATRPPSERPLWTLPRPSAMNRNCSTDMKRVVACVGSLVLGNVPFGNVGYAPSVAARWSRRIGWTRGRTITAQLVYHAGRPVDGCSEISSDHCSGKLHQGRGIPVFHHWSAMCLGVVTLTACRSPVEPTADLAVALRVTVADVRVVQGGDSRPSIAGSQFGGAAGEHRARFPRFLGMRHLSLVLRCGILPVAERWRRLWLGCVGSGNSGARIPESLAT